MRAAPQYERPRQLTLRIQSRGNIACMQGTFRMREARMHLHHMFRGLFANPSSEYLKYNDLPPVQKVNFRLKLLGSRLGIQILSSTVPSSIMHSLLFLSTLGAMALPAAASNVFFWPSSSRQTCTVNEAQACLQSSGSGAGPVTFESSCDGPYNDPSQQLGSCNCNVSVPPYPGRRFTGNNNGSSGADDPERLAHRLHQDLPEGTARVVLHRLELRWDSSEGVRFIGRVRLVRMG